MMTLEDAMKRMAAKIGAVCDLDSRRSLRTRRRELIEAYRDLAQILTALQPQRLTSTGANPADLESSAEIPEGALTQTTDGAE